MSATPRMVVFADVEPLLDGGEALHAEQVAATLRAVAAKGLPLVFCTARTRAEVEHVQTVLGSSHPFVCENGALVVVPAGTVRRQVPSARCVDGAAVVAFGPPAGTLATALTATATALGISLRALHDMAVDDVARTLGLPLDAAARAARREHTVAFCLDRPADRTRLAVALEAIGFTLAAGARFDCLGPAVDESAGIALVRQLLKREWGAILTVGLGDPLRDEALLEQVDVPIVARAGPALRLADWVAKNPPAWTSERGMRRRAYEQRAGWQLMPHAMM